MIIPIVEINKSNVLNLKKNMFINSKINNTKIPIVTIGPNLNIFSSFWLAATK